MAADGESQVPFDADARADVERPGCATRVPAEARDTAAGVKEEHAAAGGHSDLQLARAGFSLGVRAAAQGEDADEYERALSA